MRKMFKAIHKRDGIHLVGNLYGSPNSPTLLPVWGFPKIGGVGI